MSYRTQAVTGSVAVEVSGSSGWGAADGGKNGHERGQRSEGWPTPKSEAGRAETATVWDRDYLRVRLPGAVRPVASTA